MKIDAKMQAQVWQRVQGEPVTVPEQRLLLLEMETAVQIQALMGYFPGKRQVLQGLLGQTQQHIACLQGIWYLRQGGSPSLQPGKLRERDGAAILRKCYVNCVSLVNFYGQKENDPEYGIVFGLLGEEKGRQGMALLQLLGQKNGT